MAQRALLEHGAVNEERSTLSSAALKVNWLVTVISYNVIYIYIYPVKISSLAYDYYCRSNISGMNEPGRDRLSRQFCLGT